MLVDKVCVWVPHIRRLSGSPFSLFFITPHVYDKNTWIFLEGLNSYWPCFVRLLHTLLQPKWNIRNTRHPKNKTQTQNRKTNNKNKKNTQNKQKSKNVCIYINITKAKHNQPQRKTKKNKHTQTNTKTKSNNNRTKKTHTNTQQKTTKINKVFVS